MNKHTNISSAVRNQAQSPLLRLPAELRNKIYNYCALNNREKLYFRIYQRNAFLFLELDQLRPIYYPGEENFFALSTVCRQLYSETALLPFSLNALVVEVRAVIIDLRLPSAAQQAVVRELSVHHSGEHSNWIAHENDGFVAALEGYKGLRKVVFEYKDLDDCVRCHVGHRCFTRTFLRRKMQIEEKYGAQMKVELVLRHD